LYWRNKEYIGLGTSASSYYKRYRYKNNTNVIKYIENLFSGKNIVIEKEFINDELYNKEKIMLGLRLSEGVDIKYFENSKDILNKYVADGMLVIEKDRVRFTQKALFVSNSVLADFI
jgi:oxygen-independent coproporphyrinogen-3 oxidase